jgi:hypothetical protein
MGAGSGWKINSENNKAHADLLSWSWPLLLSFASPHSVFDLLSN